MNFLTKSFLLLMCIAGVAEGSTSSHLFPALSDNEKWGYIDIKGKMIIKPQFDTAGSFNEGYAVVKIDELWGVIDTSGKMVIEPQFSQISDFSEGLARAFKDESKSGYINVKGEVIVPWNLQGYLFDLAGDFKDGMAKVHPEISMEELLKIVNGDEKTIEWVKDGLRGKDKGITSNNPVGFIDKRGKLVVRNVFCDASPFSDGVSRIKAFPFKKGKCGYIDRSGKIIIEPQYDFAQDFCNGAAVVTKDNKYYIINKKGEVTADLKGYDFVSPFSEGLAIAKKDNKYGFIDTKGTLVIDLKYDLVVEFKDGVAAVAKLEGEKHAQAWQDEHKWGFIDNKGKQIIPFIYDKSSNFKDGLTLVEVKTESRYGSNCGYINKKGEFIYGPILGRWE